MALGGINAGWDETVPPDSENAGLGASRIRSLETTLQQLLDSEHNFPASGGANTGYHRYGSARVFYDVESNVSSSGTDGRLMVTSDTSRLFHVGSGGTMFLGGTSAALLNNSLRVFPQVTYNAIESGVDIDGNDKNIVAFRSAFSDIPNLCLSAASDGLATTNGYVTVVPYFVSTTNFRYRLWYTSPTPVVGTTSHCSVYYIATGTRAL